MAVEFGNFDTGVVESKSASVVTRRMRVVVSENTFLIAGNVDAIHSAMTGAAQ